MSPNGKSFYFLCEREAEAKVFLSFVLRCRRALPFPMQFQCKMKNAKFTSRVCYQCKMNGNVSCTLPDGELIN